MCFTLVVTILSLTAEMQIVLSSQCTVHTPSCHTKDPIYRQTALVLFTDLYIQRIYTSVESGGTSGCIFTLKYIARPKIV